MSRTMTEAPMTEETDGVELECEHCGYIWVYSGKMYTATCPRCNAKTPTGYGPEDDE